MNFIRGSSHVVQQGVSAPEEKREPWAMSAEATAATTVAMKAVGLENIYPKGKKREDG
jgi:hypothetical protein